MPIKPPPTERYTWGRRHVADQLRLIRNREGYTQAEVVSRLDPVVDGSIQWLSDLEKGLYAPDAVILQGLADLYEYPIEFFTNPRYDARRPQWPTTYNEWLLLSGMDQRRAEAHHQLETTLSD